MIKTYIWWNKKLLITLDYWADTSIGHKLNIALPDLAYTLWKVVEITDHFGPTNDRSRAIKVHKMA